MYTTCLYWGFICHVLNSFILSFSEPPDTKFQRGVYFSCTRMVHGDMMIFLHRFSRTSIMHRRVRWGSCVMCNSNSISQDLMVLSASASLVELRRLNLKHLSSFKTSKRISEYRTDAVAQCLYLADPTCCVFLSLLLLQCSLAECL